MTPRLKNSEDKIGGHQRTGGQETSRIRDPGEQRSWIPKARTKVLKFRRRGIRGQKFKGEENARNAVNWTRSAHRDPGEQRTWIPKDEDKSPKVQKTRD